MTRKRPSTPPGQVRRSQSAAEYARVAQVQREQFERLAQMIERGELITGHADVQMAAIALRCHAASIPAKPKRGRGRPRAIDAGDVAMLYTMYRIKPMGHAAAIEKIADAYDASTETVASALVKHRADAAAWFARFDPAAPTAPGEKSGE